MKLTVSYVPVHVPHGRRYSRMSIADGAQWSGARFVFSHSQPCGVIDILEIGGHSVQTGNGGTSVGNLVSGLL